MLTFSTNPDVAEQQMNAIIFYLTAFGYIEAAPQRSDLCSQPFHLLVPAFAVEQFLSVEWAKAVPARRLPKAGCRTAEFTHLLSALDS